MVSIISLWPDDAYLKFKAREESGRLETAKLMVTIDEKRKEMVEAAKRQGYTGIDTIKRSQELDNLMNQFLKY
jgi:stage 0 sporulation regulatory protein